MNKMSTRKITYKIGKFEQKTRRVFTTADGLKSDKITSMCFNSSGVLFAATDKGLFYLKDGKFAEFETGIKNASVSFVSFCGKILYIGVGSKLIAFSGKNKILNEKFSSPVVDVKTDSDKNTYILTETVFYKKKAGETDYDIMMGVPGCGSCMTVFRNNRVYVGTSNNGIHALVGKRWHWSSLDADSTGLLSNKVNCLYSDPAGNLWIGTDKGICVYDDKSYWLDHSSIENLPDAEITGIAVSENGDRYFSTGTGLIHQHNGNLSYYGYKRWLPSPKATGVAVSKDGTVCVSTDKGLSVIETKMMTLEEKAKTLREITETYNVRKDGFVLDRELDNEGVVSLDEGYIPNTDNDGHRTGNYLADLALEYACTKDKETRKRAKRSLLAMIKLTEITGIDGFVARAVRYPDERDYGTGVRHEWHITKDENGSDIEWLGETSSDEIVGHFFGYAYYYDLVADEKDKELIRRTVSKILDHILAHNFRLVDTDGIPTTWANWNPELLNNDNKWAEEKGTNSLQMLTYLACGYHMTKNGKYKDAYDMLASDKHYVMNLMKYRIPDGHLCHIDDNHDFLMISLLMKYTENPELKSIYAMGLTNHWNDAKAEKNSMYNFIYGAMTGEFFNADDCIDELIDYPMDLICWSLYNSHRTDLEWNMKPCEMGMEPQLESPLSAHERRIVTNDLNRFICDSGADDVAKPIFKMSDDPTAYNVFPPTGNDKGMLLRTCNNFTLPYWYGRYYGLIEEEK